MVKALLEGNEGAIRYVFYDHFKDLHACCYRKVCMGKHVELDDLVQELYLYISANNWEKLRRYDPQIPFIKWFSVVSYRFFKDYCRSMIDSGHELPICDMNDHDGTLASQSEASQTLMADLLRILPHFKPPRDRDVLKAFLIDDEDAETVAKRLEVTVDNLYNIKRRALARLVKRYLNDYKD